MREKNNPDDISQSKHTRHPQPIDETHGTFTPDIDQSKSEQDTGSPASKDPSAPATANDIEYGGRAGPDPTRYGDWEKNGRCIDF